MKDKTIMAKTYVIDPDGLILALRRSATDNRRPLTWDLPGGGVDFGEDPTAGAIRECDEEAGFKIENLSIFNVTSVNKDSYVIKLLFYAHISDRPEVKLSHEHDEYKWVTVHEFIALDVPEYQREAAKQLPQLSTPSLKTELIK